MKRQVHRGNKLIALVLLCCFSGMTGYAQSVPEACSGFRWPLSGNNAGDGSCSGNDFCNNTVGLQYAEWATVYSCDRYHPAEDWNKPGVNGGCDNGCSNDKCISVYAAATGKVVSTGNWGAVVIKHNYQGTIYYTQYGHSINVSVSTGQIVSKGQKVAEIGDVSTNCAHLHFEVRRTSHPYPTSTSYYNCSDLQNINNVYTWYADPDVFIPNRGAYNCNNNCPTTVTVSQNFSGGTHVLKASDQLNADNIIENGADVTYQAGNEVILKQGFHAKKGVSFDANLDGCQ